MSAEWPVRGLVHCGMGRYGLYAWRVLFNEASPDFACMRPSLPHQESALASKKATVALKAKSTELCACGSIGAPPSVWTTWLGG